MGIQAIKGVEVGDGFAHRRAAAAPQAHDEIVSGPPTACAARTGRAGGIEGGMIDRRAAAGARRDEADLDGAAGAAHRRRRHRRAGHGDQPALRRVRGAGGRRSSPRRWSRWCSPTPCWRSSAATRWPRPAATSRATSTHLSDRPRGALTCRLASCWSGRRGRARPPSAGGWPSASGLPFRDTDADVEADAGPVDRGHLRRRRRGGLPGAGAAAVAAALAEHDGVLALGGGAVLDPRDPACCCAGSPVVYLEVGLADAAKRVGLDRDRPLLRRQPARPVDPA